MEWEWSARGGDGDKYIYAGSNNYKDVAWIYKADTQPVKQKKPNGYGLYDMSGNVCEWCIDGYGDYPNHELIDLGNVDVHLGGGGRWHRYDKYDAMRDEENRQRWSAWWDKKSDGEKQLWVGGGLALTGLLLWGAIRR